MAKFVMSVNFVCKAGPTLEDLHQILWRCYLSIFNTKVALYYIAFLFTLGIPNFGRIPWNNPGFGAEKSLENPGIFFHFIVGHPEPCTLRFTMCMKCTCM